MEQVPCPARNTWLRGRHRSLRGRRGAPGRAMGGCEVREFLLQLGFFLPLLTVWPGDCSHVSSNQGKGRGGEAGGAGGGGCCEDRCMGRLPQVTSSRRSFSRLAPGAVQEVPSLELPVHLARDGDLPDFGPYLLPSVFKGMREPRQQLSAAAGGGGTAPQEAGLPGARLTETSGSRGPAAPRWVEGRVSHAFRKANCFRSALGPDACLCPGSLCGPRPSAAGPPVSHPDRV